MVSWSARQAFERERELSENSDARGRSAPFSFCIKTCLASKWTLKLLCAHSLSVLGIKIGGLGLKFLLNEFYEHITFSFNLAGSLLPVGVTNLALFGLFFNGFAYSF